ncbi:MAG: Asp-tRNA(Asn)/Glu-tRNA(Gln) amidotransferase subunit GatC [bacterium]|nr:Asp-tRNA(Asn)/Glu-tRNA(Gln) amidotransferase subunit GatC [bacterium]
METVEEVKKLAALSRIRIDGAELEKFAGEFDSILAYVGQLEKLNFPRGDTLRHKPALRNVMRADGDPHATGEYTGKLVAQFPANEKNALSVKQIITHTD